MMTPKAYAFDFYQTLIYPKGGHGRGRLYQDFVRDHGLQTNPWEHQVLYDVFEYYAAQYDPAGSAAASLDFWIEFSLRLFRRTGVKDPELEMARQHAETIRDIFGPNHFLLYPEVKSVLRELNRRGTPLVIVSNWQKGLSKFCRELGLRDHFDHVIASAEVGFQKPEAGIFEEAARRLGLRPSEILHVGDSLVDDVQGATSAGLQAVWLNRQGQPEKFNGRVISDLGQLLES